MAGLFEFNASKVSRAADDIAGTLAGAHLGLTQAPLPLDEDTSLADVVAVKANYDGYVRGNIDWQDPSISDDGNVECIGTCAVFRANGDVVTNDIIGCYIEDAANTELLFLGNLDGQPIPMHSALDSLTLVVRYRPASQSLTVVIS